MTPRATLAALTGIATSLALYASLRIYQALLPEADATLVLWSAHAGYFWRVLIAAYAGGMAAIAAAIATRNAFVATRRATRFLFAATFLLAIQSVFYP